MNTEDLTKLFRELGFPAGVAIFVLWRLEARLRELTQAVTSLTIKLTSNQTTTRDPSDLTRRTSRPPL